MPAYITNRLSVIWSSRTGN